MFPTPVKLSKLLTSKTFIYVLGATLISALLVGSFYHHQLNKAKSETQMAVSEIANLKQKIAAMETASQQELRQPLIENTEKAKPDSVAVELTKTRNQLKSKELEHQGDSYFVVEEYQLAKTAYQQALKLTPENSHLQRQLKKCNTAASDVKIASIPNDTE
ncbi:MAG: hypothetical protein ACKVTZ_16170 [Bacteroidia bacterium]